MPPRERLASPTSPYHQSIADYDQLRPHVQIDKHALDEEFVAQPGRYLEVAEAKSGAISHRDHAKFTLELVEGEEDSRIRAIPIPEGARKPTEAQITALIKDTQAYSDAKMLLTKWDALVGLWWGLETAMKMRGEALGKLANLWSSGYWQQSSGGAARPNRSEVEADRVRARVSAARVNQPVHQPSAEQD